jgi:hypothetical protein
VMGEEFAGNVTSKALQPAGLRTGQSEYRGRRQGALQLLLDRQADSVPHLSGCLLDHLKRTEELLIAWDASDLVSLAGLCHAAYGTDGFATALLGLDSRLEVAEHVGADVEGLVYLYASCDRKFLYPQVGCGDRVSFRDRFTGQEFPVSEESLRQFVDLTLANEYDVASVGPSSERIPVWFSSMFEKFGCFASPAVRDGCRRAMRLRAGG